MTTRSRPAPTPIPINFEGRSGLILLEQIRALDKRRLVRRLGMLDAGTLSATLVRLRQMIED
jgi:mRNA interferase MazF